MGSAAPWDPALAIEAPSQARPRGTRRARIRAAGCRRTDPVGLRPEAAAALPDVTFDTEIARGM